MNIGNFSCSRECYCMEYDASDISWLEKQVSSIGFLLKTVNSLLHWSSGSTCKDAQDTYSVRIDLITQAVCHCLQRMLGGSILADVCSRVYAHTGINKNNLSSASFYFRQKLLCQKIGCSKVNLILPVQIIDRRRIHIAKHNIASRVH